MGGRNVESTIERYFGKLEHDEHHRYRSWEHCYRFFQRVKQTGLAKHRDEAALQLGFYLASWGMYRGKAPLLQCAYTVHRPAVDCLADPRWSRLWQSEFGAHADDHVAIVSVVELRQCLGATYAQFKSLADKVLSDTLVSKIMLGTLACSPACDRYFIDGFTRTNPYSYFNSRFVTRVFEFCRANLDELRHSQARIHKSVGMRYPLMKLVDMYFFQVGVDREAARKKTNGVPKV
jgi:hypothetical protein